MLLEGTLQSWNDERGFGFIAPDGGGPQVFVHISAFQNPAARPQARQRLSYELDKPAGDKPRASRARVLGAGAPGAAASPASHTARPRAAAARTQRQATSAARSGPSGGAALLLIPTLAILLLGLGLCFGSTWRAAGWYVLASLVTFAWYAWDKAAAQQGHWRTPEKHLWLLGLLGGWPGALLAQRWLRHKSSKRDFLQVFWLTVLLNLVALCLLFSPLGQRFGLPTF
ncbi:DUF1294 domain-containing protein [Comamonas sp. JNW]|uniref:DUF1294 domain-containing protein n=1 Tax=Comamonas sp. JNW TaxID=2170731 RepID=UPI000DE794F7|nr:DUF1294 domain-containing protein [Comamonas sp. JNW]PWB20912.1 DUF1294 domain-containing protein [Comamonas sp. JNW]